MDIIQEKLEEFKKYRKEHLISAKPEDYIHIGLDSSFQFSDFMKHIEKSLKETVEATVRDMTIEKRSMLDMFCYQGPPTKKWLATEGQYWEGYNQYSALQKKKGEEILKNL